ncbi:MAG: hypothetical protein HUU50_04175 [Candidatus Brocadiae bacterium]|nr:hypothetical protein [Candidatus Brocadiia bacterium]
MAKEGRFLQRDPIEYVDGLNLYEGFANIPVNSIDFYGFQTTDEALWLQVKEEREKQIEIIKEMNKAIKKPINDKVNSIPDQQTPHKHNYTMEELFLCGVYPVGGIYTYMLKQKMFELWEVGRTDNTVENAILHCAWICAISLRCGSVFGRRIGKAHENYASNNPTSKEMDLYNNDVGVDIADEIRSDVGECAVDRYYDYEEVANICLSHCKAKALQNKLLWTQESPFDANARFPRSHRDRKGGNVPKKAINQKTG